MIFFFLYSQFLEVFFMDPDFSGSDPDFWPIRTREKKSDPDPDKRARIRNTGIIIWIRSEIFILMCPGPK